MNARHIWVICGGVSSEHEISILSAKNVTRVLKQEGYCLHVVMISKQGFWYYLSEDIDFSRVSCVADAVELGASLLHLTPGEGTLGRLADDPVSKLPCDCVFPLVHGRQGEDGIVQSICHVCCVPFVGCDVLSSAMCMSKHVTKILLESAGIATAKSITVRTSKQHAPSFETVVEELGLPVFVKPSSQGSSVGISRVSDQGSYLNALEEAFSYDSVVLLEKAIEGREMECSIIGHTSPRVSLPGEVVCSSDFYSYKAKYLDALSAEVITPADLNEKQVSETQAVALQCYRALHCQGMARVDLFLKDDGSIYVNEINTIPGFTDISMYAKNWEASGQGYASVLDELIQNALRDFEIRQSNYTDFSVQERREITEST